VNTFDGVNQTLSALLQKRLEPLLAIEMDMLLNVQECIQKM
jgi:hypothetical protein